MIAARLEPYFKPAADARKREHGGTTHGVTSRRSMGSETRDRSASEAAGQAAAAMGVGVSSVGHAKHVLTHGTPALVAAVDAGSISVDAANKIAALAPEEQDKASADPAVARGIAGAIRRGALPAPVVSAPPPPPEPHKTMSRKGLKMPANPLSSLELLAHEVIDTWEREAESAMIVEKWERATAIQRQAFVKSLDDLIASTRHIKKGLNNDAPKEELS
jgi:hypothetical protein